MRPLLKTPGHVWDRTATMTLAYRRCTSCDGLGLAEGRVGRAAASFVCGCVLRKIFSLCYAKFQKCAAPMGIVRLESSHRKNSWGMRSQEYVADFCLVAKRVLGEDTQQHNIFKYHFLLGAECGPCCRRLGIDRGAFFHQVYRIQESLGKAFAELQPHALWPLDEYFGGRVRTERRAVHPLFRVETESEPARPIELRFPLAKAA